jgi:outer membrane immunogenic protein
VTNWGGFYIGANGGYGWDPASATFNPATYATAAIGALGPFVVTGASPPINLSVHPQGWLGGGQIGYNWQQNSLVLGLEADVDWSGMRASTSAPFFVNGTIGGDIANFTGNVGLSQSVEYFGAARGRIGWPGTRCCCSAPAAWRGATSTRGSTRSALRPRRVI